MIKEKMLEYLMLNEVLSRVELSMDDKDRLMARRQKLQDEFINEQLAYLPNITHPVKDFTNME